MALRQPGHVFNGRYEVVRFLGAGGFAAVYEARDQTINRPVALKVLNLAALSIDPAGQEVFIKRFHREAQVAASIRNSNAVSIFDFGTTSDTQEPFLVMELLIGHDLEAELTQNGPIAPPRAISLLMGSLAALGEAHSMGVVHKDLKPANLFLTDPGTRRETLKVVDFGIARIVDGGGTKAKFTGTGQILGTPQYLAPEYIESQSVTPALDVYQMALILCEMLTGRPVVDCENPLKAVMVHSAGNLPINDALRAMPFWDVIDKALSMDPAERYDNADTFAEALLERASEAAALNPTASGADWRRTLAPSSRRLLFNGPSSEPATPTPNDTASPPPPTLQPVATAPTEVLPTPQKAPTLIADSPPAPAPATAPKATRTPTVLGTAPAPQPSAPTPEPETAPKAAQEETAPKTKAPTAAHKSPTAVLAVDHAPAPAQEKASGGNRKLLAAGVAVILLLGAIAGIVLVTSGPSSVPPQNTAKAPSKADKGTVADNAKDARTDKGAAADKNAAQKATNGAATKANKGAKPPVANKDQDQPEQAPAPKATTSAIGRARTAAKRGNHKEALGLLKPMLAGETLTGEDRLQVLELMAFALLEAGDAAGDETQRHQDAVELLRELLKLNPDYTLPKDAPESMTAILDQARKEAQDPSPVEVSILTTPRNATVFVDNKPLPAPAIVRFDSKDADPIKITVRARHHDSRTLKIKPSAGTVRVALKRKPRSMSIVETP